MEDDGKCIMFDPQFSTIKNVAGPWDRGVFGLRTFERDHGCSKFCTYLGLNLVKKGGMFPSRPRPKPHAAEKADDHSESPGLLAGTGLDHETSTIDPVLLRTLAPVSGSLSDEARAADFKGSSSLCFL